MMALTHLMVCRNWYKTMIRENVLDLGFAGWMADFGEYTPVEARTQFPARWWGEDRGEILHQRISQEWAKLNMEVVEEAGKAIRQSWCQNFPPQNNYNKARRVPTVAKEWFKGF